MESTSGPTTSSTTDELRAKLQHEQQVVRALKFALALVEEKLTAHAASFAADLTRLTQEKKTELLHHFEPVVYDLKQLTPASMTGDMADGVRQTGRLAARRLLEATLGGKEVS